MSNSEPYHDTVNRWLDHLKKQGKSKHTRDAYYRGLAHFIVWSQTTYGEDFDPAATIRRDVVDWKAHQQTVELAKPATINQRLVAISQFFTWAMAMGITGADPTTGVKAIPLARQAPKALSRVDKRRLLRAVHRHGDLRDVAILEMLLGTGLRVSELLALRLGDVELSERTGRVTVRSGKRGNYRQVPIPRDARQALQAYLDQRDDVPDPGRPLWLGASESGQLTRRSSASRIVDKYALAAGIEYVSPHALRHTFATEYLNANPGRIRELAALLGHASLDTVMIYTEPAFEHLAETVEEMDRS